MHDYCGECHSVSIFFFTETQDVQIILLSLSQYTRVIYVTLRALFWHQIWCDRLMLTQRLEVKIRFFNFSLMC